MDALASFRAAHGGGLTIRRPTDVTALALIFDRVFLPANLDLLKELARIAPVSASDDTYTQILPYNEKRFADLTPAEHAIVANYLSEGLAFIGRYKELFGPVFETNLFASDPIASQVLFSELSSDYTISFANLTLTDTPFNQLITDGYVPIVTTPIAHTIKSAGTTALAAALALEAVRITFPSLRATSAGDILEARYRLRDHLPPFWSAMLKLTVELRRAIDSNESPVAMETLARDIIDRTVRPALIDLRSKLEKERKDWAYRILAPIQRGLRLLITNPPITQQQLLVNALVIGSDTLMSFAENMRTIESLKAEAGLTFLLHLPDVVEAAG